MSKSAGPAASLVCRNTNEEKSMLFQVTALYALPLAILFLVLWFRVTTTRSNLKVSIGDAGDTGLHEKIRQHGNFVEWAPIVLILMIIAEGNKADAIWLHVSGALLLIGRLIHPFGLTAANPAHPLRIIGNTSSLLATLTVMVCVVVTSFGL
jgi:uncharacterized membrane protein YecN with MAPEG domain